MTVAGTAMSGQRNRPFASEGGETAGALWWPEKIGSPVIISLLLALTTLAVLWPVTQNDFVNYDDLDYVTANAHVQSGLNWKGVVWAFTTGHASNWHPLTWLSHMVDCQLFGQRAGAHHLMSLLFHAANTVLLFLVLRGLTGALWRSVLVAGLFALHPLHVESVAWVAERKDVLSAFFFLLTIGAYRRYAEQSGVCNLKSKVGKTATEDKRRRPGIKESQVKHPKSKAAGEEADARSPVARDDPAPFTIQHSRFRPWHFYALALILFALGLMSKPMLVTLPFVLLLLDYWPLGRLNNPRPKLKTAIRLLLEKVPFLALSLVSSFVTFQVQKHGGAVSVSLSVGQRIANALVSYVRYMGKLFWPENLSVLYPHPGKWPLPEVIACAASLAAITVAVVALARRKPYLPVGWLWFLGTLVPVIGLVQVGVQAMADRYSYLPLIGLFVMLAWGLND